MARIDYLKDKPYKPKWYEYKKPAPTKPAPTKPAPTKPAPTKQQQIWDEPGVGPAFWQTNNTEPEFGYVPGVMFPKPIPWQNQYPAWMKPPVNKPPVNKPSVPWTNPLPEQHNRPAYFNNRSTPANFNRWLDSFEQPEKAIEVIEKDYLQYEKTLNEQLALKQAYNPDLTSYLDDKSPWWQRLGAFMQQGVADYGQLTPDRTDIPQQYWRNPTPNDERLYVQAPTPDNPQGTIYGNRFMEQREARNYAYPPDNTNKFLTDYQAMDQAREKGGKAYQLEYALTQASPLFQPITDEFGNVLAPALLTPKEYAEGVEDGKIYDPNMPESTFKYGTTDWVYAAVPGQTGKQLLPAEVWYRAQDRYLQGDPYSGFADKNGLGYTHFDKSFLPNTTRTSLAWEKMGLNPLGFFPGQMGPRVPPARDPLVSTADYDLIIKAQQTPYPFANVDLNVRPNQAPGTPYQETIILPALETVDELVGEDAGLGDGGGWGGGGWGGGYGSSYWGNPNSSGYYGNQNYGPNYWGNSGGYGSSGYGGSNSYGPNYQGNQFGLRKGQYFSQLARWVI